jgi:hypothetical protein
MGIRKRKAKVWFTGFHDTESMRRNLLYRAISRDFNVELTEDCDFLFVDYKDYVYHKKFLEHDCVRILYSSENLYPDYNLVDYALCPNFLPAEDRFLWLPVYWWFSECWELSKRVPSNDWAQRQKFCCFIVSNDNAEPMRSLPSRSMREHMFEELSKYRRIDSPGLYKRNMPPIELDSSNDFNFFKAKIQFMKDYRFALVFENSRSPGYTTEKIVHALLADCIPIYWGDPLAELQFDPNQFIWVRGEADVQGKIDLIKEIDNDPALSSSYFRGEAKATEQFKEICNLEYVSRFLRPVLSGDRQSSMRRSRYYLSKAYETSLMASKPSAPAEAGAQLGWVKADLPLSEFLAHTSVVSATTIGPALRMKVAGEYKGYVQTFGGAFKTPPKTNGSGLALIPAGTKAIEASLDFKADARIILALYIIQYDSRVQLRSEFKETPASLEGSCKLTVNVAEEAQLYKVAIRAMRPDRMNQDFLVDISNFDLAFGRVKGKDEEGKG